MLNIHTAYQFSPVTPLRFGISMDSLSKGNIIEVKRPLESEHASIYPGYEVGTKLIVIERISGSGGPSIRAWKYEGDQVHEPASWGDDIPQEILNYFDKIGQHPLIN